MRHFIQTVRTSSRGLFVVVSILALALSASAAFGQVTCEQGDRWIEENKDALPETIQDFAKVPAEYRSSAFLALGAEKRSALWAEHIDQMVRDLSDLNADEVAEVQAATDLFENPEKYRELTEDGALDRVLGIFAARITGQVNTDPTGQIVPVSIPDCNCDTNLAGCVRVFCMPTQCGTAGPPNYDCGGMWQSW